MMTLVAIESLVLIIYVIADLVKIIFFSKHQDLYKYIPITCAVIGGVLGAIIWQFAPGIAAEFGWDNIIDSVAIGIASGFASTGVNQAYKQPAKSYAITNTINGTVTTLDATTGDLTSDDSSQSVG
jgi:hypothetical protein